MQRCKLHLLLTFFIPVVGRVEGAIGYHGKEEMVTLRVLFPPYGHPLENGQGESLFFFK